MPRIEQQMFYDDDDTAPKKKPMTIDDTIRKFVELDPVPSEDEITEQWKMPLVGTNDVRGASHPKLAH